MALHVVEKTDAIDFFVSAVAVLEGSPFPVSEFPRIPVDVWLRERSLDLWNFIGGIVGANDQVKVTKTLRMGSLAKEIAIVVQKENVDLIVLELRKRFLFPNLAALRLLKTIRSLRCPVLLNSAIEGHSREPKKPVPLIRPTPEETVA